MPTSSLQASAFREVARLCRVGIQCKFRQFSHKTPPASRFFFPKMRRKRRKCRRFEELCRRIGENCRRIGENCRGNFGFCRRIHRKCRGLQRQCRTSRKAVPAVGLPDRPPPPRFPHLLHTPIYNTAGLTPSRNWFLAHFRCFCAIFSINLYALLHYSLRQYARTVQTLGFPPPPNALPTWTFPKAL